MDPQHWLQELALEPLFLPPSPHTRYLCCQSCLPNRKLYFPSLADITTHLKGIPMQMEPEKIGVFYVLLLAFFRACAVGKDLHCVSRPVFCNRSVRDIFPVRFATNLVPSEFGHPSLKYELTTQSYFILFQFPSSLFQFVSFIFQCIHHLSAVVSVWHPSSFCVLISCFSR
jgi:hypothetical protein